MGINTFQEKGNDAIIRAPLKDPIQIPNEPVTKARAKRFKEAFHGLIMTIQDETKETLFKLAPMDGHGLLNVLQAREEWAE